MFFILARMGRNYSPLRGECNTNGAFQMKKGKTMVNKKFWLGMLVMVLVFGMTVVGCDLFETPTDDNKDEYDNRPYYYGGTVKFDKKVDYPVVGETFTATHEYEKVVEPIGTASWKWYKTQEKAYSFSGVTDKAQIGTGDTYTLKTTDVGYWIWAEVSYSGNRGSNAGQISTFSTVLSNPRLPLGSVEFDKNYPVVGETITANFRKNPYSSDPNPVGTPSWQWYKTQDDANSLANITNKTSLGSGTTYTLKQADSGYWIWAEVSYSGNSGTESSRTSSTVIGIPATATVSVSVEASRVLNPSSITSLTGGNHRVKVTLTLSDGKWNDVSYSTASQWLSITGTPSISSWTGLFIAPYVSAMGRKLEFSYQTNSDTILPINLTVALNTAQLSTMRSSTNVYNTLTAGTPATVSVSQWTFFDY